MQNEHGTCVQGLMPDWHRQGSTWKALHPNPYPPMLKYLGTWPDWRADQRLFDKYCSPIAGIHSSTNLKKREVVLPTVALLPFEKICYEKLVKDDVCE